jgi:ABC-type lipoprotein release transport system permease subunit
MPGAFHSRTGLTALERELYRITALDPRIFTSAVLLLLLVAWLAALIPAERAARLDLALSLRTE